MPQTSICLTSNLQNKLSTKRYASNIAIKLSIAQAYNTNDWKFIFLVFEKMGFVEMGISWIKTILYSPRVSILINSGPKGFIQYIRDGSKLTPCPPLFFLLPLMSLA